ncbi:ATR serine/threonine kinase meiotic 41 [Musca autumnalis]|uniref:ATR serine/threonine kinase meiotic 41 n=1 Tax=Musca autumnalis TaxID=221902 RepID=UPI003CEA227E
MADRRKDMWRLLYSVVNRDETGLLDILVFVDDILCKEPSLIRHSLKANTNKFQDAFILWLVNKLLRSLNLQEAPEGELFSKNLKIQRKLLNSCLVNRVVLFEKLLQAYLNAIEELCEQYGKLDTSMEDVVLKTTAFSTEDHESLRDIDGNFNFPVIEINSDDLDEFVQALMQILHHGLCVGYINFPKIFQNNLLVIFKALKVCDFPTKLICLQYVGRVFERTWSLVEMLGLYELSLRSLTTMWNYCPMWLANNCLSQDNLEDFIEESCSLLRILYKFVTQLEKRVLIERHCFQLMENLYEVHQWQGLQKAMDVTRLKEVVGALMDFIFALFVENLKSPSKFEAKYSKAVMKYAEIFPFVLRAVTPHLTRTTNRDDLADLLRYLELKLGEAFKAKDSNLKKVYGNIIEYLSFLYLLEHLMVWREQKSVGELKEVPEKSVFMEVGGLNVDSLKNSLKSWLSNVTSTNSKTINPNEVLICGLLLQSHSLKELFSSKQQEKLMDLILKPLQNIDISLKEPPGDLLHSSELALDILGQLNPNTLPACTKTISHTLLHLGKRVFGERNSHRHLLSAFSRNIQNFVVNEWLTPEQIAKDLAKNIKEEQYFLTMLKTFACLNATNTTVIIQKYFKEVHQISSHNYPQLLETQLSCCQCYHKSQENKKLKDFQQQHMAVLKEVALNSSSSCNTIEMPSKMKQYLLQEFFTNPQMEFITQHLDFCRQAIGDNFLKSLFPSADNKTSLHLATVTPILSKCISENPEFLKEISANILSHIIESLKPQQSAETQLHHQQTILQIISSCSQSQQLSELWLYHFFKMFFFYLIHPESKVVQEAILNATEMCSVYQKQPIQLWNWYKRDALNLMVKLMIYVYISRGVRMTRSLKAFTKMLGFACVQEFICKYYRLLVTMILPYCVKEPRCKGLLISISKITRKPVNNLFIVSFLRIYTHIYLTEEPEIGNRCIELIGKCTGASLSKLMNTDVKQTVSEFLVYFNRSPTFVMQAFSCLLPNEVGGSNTASASSSTSLRSFKSSTHEFSNFIADRFLGVITYFQTCLSEPYFEKPLKEETLYSLGQIMRLIGPNNVTQFRFKIIAMLSFVLTLDDKNLQNICLKIWNIFLHTVNIEELGPSLSRIVASLQPLVEHYEQEINDIYEFLILKSGSLLGSHISDLYFLKDTKQVRPVIRQSMARQTELLKLEGGEDIAEKLSFLYNQICNENSQVRIYGLDYLGSFINRYRSEINHMILDTIPLNPLIERIVDEVIKGCRHEDRNIHLASAKCLGELGAIDPSYMSANFSFMESTEISLSMHTDDFAIMALTELCRAYQFQKDSKYVDNFSLAIQETLAVFGISPRESKKLNVWDALPTRMQQIMEPLLSSCYTGSRRDKKISEHPLFNSSLCRSYEEWSFAWACRLIEWVQTDDTRRLLNSYKPSMKRDSKMLSIFFPYILLHVLQECEEGKEVEIYEEFMAVFNFCNRDATLSGRVDVGGFKEFKSSKYSADKVNSSGGGGTGGLGGATNASVLGVGASEQFDALETVTQTCTKLCSEQIDFLKRWIREWQKQNMMGGKFRQEDVKYKNIDEFLKKFNKALISKANYNSGEYARALLYLEEYIEEKPAKRLQEQLSYLIEIHGKLMDSDSVEGAVFVKETDLSLEEEILVNRLVDRPQETINCYQQLLLKGDAQISQDHVSGIIQCYLRTDTPETALLIIDGLWEKLADQYNDDYFKECKTELLWRLGRYDELQELLEDTAVKSKTSNWNIQCAEAFLLFRQPSSSLEDDFFGEQLDNIRSHIVASMRSCSGVTGNSYTHSYDEATRLHLLNEVEKNKNLLNKLNDNLKKVCLSEGSNELHNLKDNCLQNLQEFFSNWDARLVILEPSARILEVMCFRRNLLLETQRILQQNFKNSQVRSQQDLLNPINSIINEQIVKLWLRSIQMNRESGCLQQAEISMMKAEPYKPATLFLEKAKLLWQKGDQTNCFKLLQDNINALEGHCNGDIKRLEAPKRNIYAEAKFLQATFNAESMNICSELNLQYFKEALVANRTSEKCLLHYAQYMEKIYESYNREQKECDSGCTLLVDIMLYYAKSLKYGHSHVYQSLPRILSIWLDFTSHLASQTAPDQQTSSSSSSSINATKMALFQNLAKKMNDMIMNCVNVLPTSLFYTAFSQLLSRICHPSGDVFRNLCNIVIKLIEHFPHQSLWMLLPIIKSCHTTRIKRSRLILTDARLNKTSFQKLLNDFNILAERLIELTNKDIPFDRTYQLSTLVRQLPQLFADPKFSNIMLPFEKYMQASFPITSQTATECLNATSVSVNPTPDVTMQAAVPSYPFPNGVFICGISEEVVVLRSAAKPKKITIECSDGKAYNVMVKPKDDLRKDFRLMEFNGLVKRYLHQDPQARHRHLRIRTYAAIPFNEECGLVEWLPNLNSFRGICTGIYRMRGLGIPDRNIRQYALPKTDPIEKKRAVFQELLARNPPVFHEWFRQRFHSPHSWYQARSSYVKTTSVMSMVGYILGLGDRHGENILFDETNGDAVHVDFNCLFNQGESFAYPELVPFRLTHNMTFAMGPLGVEGLFRKCCEITLRLLKGESKTLMSVLRPFVYDIGVIDRLKTKKTNNNLEVTDPKAMLDVKRIEERLQGYVKRTQGFSIPLSTEGHVNFLINEATDLDNLAAMYIGWGSYI